VTSVRKIEWLSPEDYLEGERHSMVRHEYVAGQLYAMTGASDTHNLIAGALYAALRARLRGGPCRVFIADMKVRTAEAFYYPDVLVGCDPADTEPYYKTRPSLIVEVSSPSTERADALEKRVAYQGLDSLVEYALVAQERMEVLLYRRTLEGWDLLTFGPGDRVAFRSVDLELPIEAIYEDI
jgi:Uma2 family endonuclease